MEDDTELQEEYLDLLHEMCGMTDEDLEVLRLSLELTVKDESKFQHKTILKIAEKAVSV